MNESIESKPPISTMAPTPDADSGPVRPVTEHDASLLATFFRRTWDPEASRESVLAWMATSRRENLVEPGELIPAYAFHRNGEIIGYLGTLTAGFWDGRAERPGHWMKGFWVLDEYRNGPVGFQLLRYATEDLGLCGVMTVAPPSVRLFGAMGFVDLDILENQVSFVRPGRFLQRVSVADLEAAGMGQGVRRAFSAVRAVGIAGAAGWGLGLALRLVDRIRSLRATPVVERLPMGEIGSEALDALWLGLRGRLRSSMVRDAAYLKTRFDLGDGRYATLAATDGGRLSGLAVVRRPTADGGGFLSAVRVAVLADLVVDPDDLATARTLIREARREARAMGADLLIASLPHASASRLLRAPHFLSRPGNVHLMVRAGGSDVDFSESLPEWWSNRGDANSDEGL